MHTAIRFYFPFLTLTLCLCAALAASAQPLRFYIGPTIGVTTPGLRKHVTETGVTTAEYVHEKRTPIVSPLVGISTGFNLFNRLGMDAGVHYSYTGYRYSYDFAGTGMASRYDERMVLHRVSVPVTLGYGVGLGRARLRLGAGIAYTWYFDGKFKSEETGSKHGSADTYAAQVIDLVSDKDGYSPVYPRQVHPRLSLSFAPTKRLIIGMAATLGYNVTLPQEGTQANVNRSEFSTHALDATATWSLR